MVRRAHTRNENDERQTGYELSTDWVMSVVRIFYSIGDFFLSSYDVIQSVPTNKNIIYS